MDDILLSIHPSDPAWIAIAFIFGFLVKLVGLPPLVGFLFAGFFLNILGAKSGEFLSAITDLGITLLLFSIGLKLKLKSLAKPEIWGVASIHMIATSVLMAGFLLLLSGFKFAVFNNFTVENALLVGFVLSFSSTVFAVKILDELGASSARHGQIAIGVLIVQDIAAVAFITASTGKVPSLWALSLLALIPLRHVFYSILDRVGHGELLVLFGIVLALGGANLFELVDMKGDVGALIIGILLAEHSKARELAKALLSFKELFLVGFFLSVGMTAMPGWEEIIIATLILVFLPIKVALYYGLFAKFNLRAITAWRTSLNLANYSEFGLIVGSLATVAGWLPKEWLAIFAVALSISFVISAPLVNVRDAIYNRWRPVLSRFETEKRLPDEAELKLCNMKAAIFGMGRVGRSVYHSISENYGDQLVAVEVDADRVETQKKAGLNVIEGDATNPDFWLRAQTLHMDLEWVLLTLPTHQANVAAIHQLRDMGYKGKIAATSKFDDDCDELKSLGVEMSFNIYAEAGTGFANDFKKSAQIG